MKLLDFKRPTKTPATEMVQAVLGHEPDITGAFLYLERGDGTPGIAHNFNGLDRLVGALQRMQINLIFAHDILDHGPEDETKPTG